MILCRIFRKSVGKVFVTVLRQRSANKSHVPSPQFDLSKRRREHCSRGAGHTTRKQSTSIIRFRCRELSMRHYLPSFRAVKMSCYTSSDGDIRQRQYFHKPQLSSSSPMQHRSMKVTGFRTFIDAIHVFHHMKVLPDARIHHASFLLT